VQSLKDSQRIVIKIGSSLITAGGQGLDRAAISNWAEQMAQLQENGKELILVSSGAVAEGMSRLGWTKRPVAIHELQAAAAVGQMGLIQAYESQFQKHGIHTSQVLLTHEDLANRERYLNARSTLHTLLKLGTIPVVNENDTVANDEIRFGDNDTLSALVANLVEADCLIILTDQTGLFDSDPSTNPDAQLIQQCHVSDPQLDTWAGPSTGSLGLGGMVTKIQAARRAARSGTHTVIASGSEPNVLLRLANGENIGTLLDAEQSKQAARKQWLASRLRAAGTLIIDDGAEKVLTQSGASLLAVGVKGVQGQFVRGEMVSCKTQSGREIACGLVNYNSDETKKIIGKSSEEIKAALGYIDEPELIHRDNLVLVT